MHPQVQTVGITLYNTTNAPRGTNRDSQVRTTLPETQFLYLHQVPFLCFVLPEEVVAVYSDVFIVLVVKTSHIPRPLCPAPSVPVNGDHIRDLGLPVYNVRIVERERNGKEYLNDTESKQNDT